MEQELTVAQVADFCGCHRCTVLNYEARGYIRSLRDCNNFRRFPRREAKKLKEILSIRKPPSNVEAQS
jgi:DNA-binding transcriptional MerR regulator